MKKSAKNRQSNASKKHGKHKTGLPKGSTITEIPVQKVTAKSSSISQKEVLRCSCYRNGFCIIRDGAYFLIRSSHRFCHSFKRRCKMREKVYF